MCGIFGIVTKKDSGITYNEFKRIFDALFKLSESRGKEASGVAFVAGGKIIVYKESVSASVLLNKVAYRNLFNEKYANFVQSDSNVFGAIGHARLVTNGALDMNENNQPVIKDGIVGVHNGIIVNDNDLWTQFPSLNKKYEVDTEIILSLIRMFLGKEKSLIYAVKSAFDLIQGTVSLALLFEDRSKLLLATNNGSLFLCTSKRATMHFFASELYMIIMLIRKHKLEKFLGDYTIHQITPNSCWFIDFDNLGIEKICFSELERQSADVAGSIGSIDDVSPYRDKVESAGTTPSGLTIIAEKFSEEHFEYLRNKEIIEDLRRCKNCILPETMPFIEFDTNGICNYCLHYRKMEIKGEVLLNEIVTRYRNKDRRPDSLFCLSGGRDSSFGLHYVKKVLGLNPIAYSYDWGMITDLGRRNQARMCGKLGVEHILISANINKKREYIRKNVVAWLKRPDLGVVPLFMSGDKQFFYYANKLKKQNDLGSIIMCINPLEKTDFKSGFCGVMPDYMNEKRKIYTPSVLNRIKLASYYAKEFALNPAYLNRSIVDTVFAYFSYYFIPHDYVYLYQYVKWDEKNIESTLINEYDWEIANDTKTTWRIGDGTASFYNYIYYTISGFSENDTLRSNQVREGMMTRDEALASAHRDNSPRFDAIQWYCATIGIDFVDAIKRIHAIPKLY